MCPVDRGSPLGVQHAERVPCRGERVDRRLAARATGSSPIALAALMILSSMSVTLRTNATL
jgi:hypothetical protein